MIGFLVTNGVIDAKEIEVYKYGFNLFLKKILHSLVFLAIGFVDGRFLGTFIFLICYSSIREYSGGYHAKTSIGCYLCTGVVSLILLALLNLLPEPKNAWSWVLLLLSGAIIWFRSPQEAENKVLETQEIVRYRTITRRHLIIWGVASLFGILYVAVLKGILCAWIIQSVMLFLKI